MSYNPATLRKLGAYWTDRGGVNLGVVGDGRHAKGYHLGEDRIYDGSGPGLGGADYSVQTARDKAGLSEAASAIDLGRLNDRLHDLWEFSVWLVKQCRADALGTRDIREVIYSPDGKRVLRYDRQRGVTSIPREGEADASHLSHTHISFYRDSEYRDKVRIFAPYFAPPPPPDTATEATAMKYDPAGGRVIGTLTFTRDTQLIRWDGSRTAVPKGLTRNVYGIVRAEGREMFLVTYQEAAAYVVNDDRAKFVEAPDPDKAVIADLQVRLSAALKKIAAAAAALR